MTVKLWLEIIAWSVAVGAGSRILWELATRQLRAKQALREAVTRCRIQGYRLVIVDKWNVRLEQINPMFPWVRGLDGASFTDRRGAVWAACQAWEAILEKKRLALMHEEA